MDVPIVKQIWDLIQLLAFDSVQSAVAQGVDVVIIDTAGRLQQDQFNE